ncbi:MAG: 1-deoxy-D-xylulose-5-phosphate reductoisomerase [Clostridiales bacterium]|nr:1-deoxy-D-xylulose-5-phosphate reductoisomerase [Clostridiales bacterium]
MAKSLSILGSTGSIGKQALEVAANLNLDVAAVCAASSIDALERQIDSFAPRLACVFDEGLALELSRRLKGKGSKCEVVAGEKGLEAAASIPDADTVLNALVGSVGLSPTLKAIEAGKAVALANKETLVSGGFLVTREAKARGIPILPVDSEHSAIFQCLQERGGNAPRRLFLTASGGPFLRKTKEELLDVCVEDALKHPNWTMGRKITIDSATMMNKGLEVIEAKWLFDVCLEQIEVLVHPQSIIHSMVEFGDGAVIAQLGLPDMRLPIQYALTCPQRVCSPYEKIDFLKHPKLTFEAPDIEKFPSLALAYAAAKEGGLLPAVMNGANEIAVDAFLRGMISFVQMPALIESVLSSYNSNIADYRLSDVLEADRWSRIQAKAKLALFR